MVQIYSIILNLKITDAIYNYDATKEINSKYPLPTLPPGGQGLDHLFPPGGNKNGGLYQKKTKG